MANLIRKFPELENELFKAYDILSEAGFEILIEDGHMTVWPKGATIENDIEEGFVIVSEDDIEEFEERQEMLLDGEEDEDTTFMVENIEWNVDEVVAKIHKWSGRTLPTSVEISDDVFFDHFGEIVDINEENVAIFLNEEYMTEPKSFKIIL